MLTARFTGAIASAVAGEVNRLQQHPEFFRSEGAAYKAAWDRLGADAGRVESPALNLCESFRRDCLKFDAVRAMRGLGFTMPEALEAATFAARQVRA